MWSALSAALNQLGLAGKVAINPIFFNEQPANMAITGLGGNPTNMAFGRGEERRTFVHHRTGKSISDQDFEGWIPSLRKVT